MERHITRGKSTTPFRDAVDRIASQWLSAGPPSRQVIDEAADRLQLLRDEQNGQGLWTHPPVMATATLDDGLGQGLAVIERYASVIGMRLITLGLMQAPEAVVDACRRHRPDFLGLTVLQFDTEDDLKFIADHLPTKTRILAGGPVFSGDADFAQRTGIHYVARHVGDFLRFMLHTAAS
jgi:methylmalonyl-CoA mutase cobalamin-binding subunit